MLFSERKKNIMVLSHSTWLHKRREFKTKLNVFTNFCCFPDCQVIIFFPLISVRCSLNPIKSKMVFFLNTDCFCMCLISNYLLLFCEFGYFGFKTSCFQLVISVVMLDVMSVSHLLFLLVNFFVFIGKHVIIYY